MVVIGSFLPWVISGSAQRDSYATIRVAKNVGVVGMTLWETLLSIWYVTPLLAAVVVVGVLLHRPPLARLAAIPLGAIALALAALVRFAPVDHGIGPVVTLLGSVGLLTAAGWSFRADRRLRTREPTPGLVPNA